MNSSARLGGLAAIVFLCCVASAFAGNKVSTDQNGVLEINGTKTFVISVAVPPPPDGKTPWGKDSFAELRDAGCNFIRVTQQKREEDGPSGPRWGEAGIAETKRNLDALAKIGMYGWVYLYDLGVINTDAPNHQAKEQLLKKVITTFKDHPAVGAWKGADEPAWGKVKPEYVIRTYQIIREVDTDHPVLILHAPKFDWKTLVPYMPGTDITGADIFPIGYPPGRHGDLPNREPSMVGDYTKWVREAAMAGGNKPYWMTLQFAWSGVGKPGKTVRFPTLPQQRLMTYQAIIYGARGVNYFGGAIESTLNERDKPLGYNWTYWERTLRYVLEEINEKSPLYPALLVADSKLKVGVEQILSIPPGDSAEPPPLKPAKEMEHYPAAKGVDFCVREVGNEIFIIAAKREGDTVHLRFTGLPASASGGEVLFESPRKITLKNGSFDDWFGPGEVHVYRIKRQ